MLKSFASPVTEKIFLGGKLTKKERKSIGALNVTKASERLIQLHTADEKALLTAPYALSQASRECFVFHRCRCKEFKMENHILLGKNEGRGIGGN